MMRTLALLSVCAVLAAALPVSAHHSTAMYTGSKTITGKVVKFEWTNPHAHVYIETKDEKGSTVVWDCEMMSLNHLRSYGWTSKTLQVGGHDFGDRHVCAERRARNDCQPNEARRRPRDLVLINFVLQWRAA